MKLTSMRPRFEAHASRLPASAQRKFRSPPSLERSHAGTLQRRPLYFGPLSRRLQSTSNFCFLEVSCLGISCHLATPSGPLHVSRVSLRLPFRTSSGQVCGSQWSAHPNAAVAAASPACSYDRCLCLWDSALDLEEAFASTSVRIFEALSPGKQEHPPLNSFISNRAASQT